MVIVWHDTIGLAPHLQKHLRVPISLIQNGVRSDVAPAGGRSFRDQVNVAGTHQAFVDTYYVFGEQSEAFLQPIVSAKYVHAGSFRLNEYVRSRKQTLHKHPEEMSLGLIVSFPNRTDVPTGKVRGNRETFVSVSHFQLSYHSYFRIDEVVAQIATEITRELGISFSIIGKRKDSDGLEREYFGSIPGCENVPVLGHEKGSGYHVAERFTHLLAIDSTLGYEMLALGKRVGFVANRLRVAGIASEELTFGHPLSLPSDGPFWTSASTPAGIREFVIRFLKLSDTDWAEQHRTITPRLMKLDPGNTMLRAHIDSTLVKSR